MGPGGVFGRMLQWLANEVIVKGLANNTAFQRFAVRSSQQAKDLSKSASEAVRNLSESEAVSQVRREGEQMRRQANGFASALREEIEMAMRGESNKRSPPPPSKSSS